MHIWIWGAIATGGLIVVLFSPRVTLWLLSRGTFNKDERP